MPSSAGQRNLFEGAEGSGEDSELTGTVSRITYRSEESGYTVLRVAPEGEERTLAVVGRMPPLALGERISVRGHWVDHPRFGRQLQVRLLRRLTPRTAEAIVRYLGSGLAKGIGPGLARRLVDAFGEATLEVIEKSPKRLAEVPGISAAKARSLVEAVRENAQLRDLTLFLEESGLGCRYAVRIHERYGAAALDVVRENPYRLVRDIWGIGFVRADALARHMGIRGDDPARVEAGIVHALRRSADLGDVYLPEEELVRRACELLSLDVLDVERGLHRAVRSGRLVREDDRIYTAGLHRAESSAAAQLRAHLDDSALRDGLRFREDSLERLQRAGRLQLSADQVEALRLAHGRAVVVITGGPGTGKTTLTKFLLDLFDGHGFRLALAAPTGRAARRLSEATGREASTLHRLLGFDPSTGIFGRDESNPVEADVILVDEASMVDLRLFEVLIRAVPIGCRLVLVGDADQLPSVGPGEVLRDLIRSGEVPTARLRQVFRQGERSGIVRNAHRVLVGERPLTCAFGEGDFIFVQGEDPRHIAEEVRRIVREALPRWKGLDPVRDVQVLVPMYKGEAGADTLNAALQEDLNPHGAEVRAGGRCFRERDRVIQLRNDYQRNIFNGEIGLVEEVARDGSEMHIRFDTLVSVPASEWDQVSLAYAITVHKSQGSEYDWVVFPLTTQHAILLERPLFYTAITRARKGVVLVGSRRALALALRAGRSRGRRTGLAERIRGESPRADPAGQPEEGPCR